MDDESHLQSVDNIQAGDGLSLSMLGVGDGIADDRFEERFEDTTGLFIDHGLHTWSIQVISQQC